MHKQHIFIIGMMGTGKTSVGTRLAAQLGYACFDTDHELEAAWGYEVATFFAQHGEQAFREEEQAMLQRLAQQEIPAVITTGGGIVLSQANRQCMREYGRVIALTAQLDELVRRLQHDQTRPLLAGDLRERIQRLTVERVEKYRFAERTIDTTERTISAIVEEITTYLSKASSSRSS
jgi:shikimate kinase